MIIFCGGLIYVMYRVLGTQATQATDRFSTMSEDFERKKSEIKKLTQESELKAEKLLMSTQQECEKLKSVALEESQQMRLKEVQDARKEAERIVTEAMKARESMKLELVEQMHGKTIDAAHQLVLRVFPVKLRKDIHDYWIQELLEHGLQALDRFDSREEIKTVEIESAFPLDDHHRKKVLDAIKRKLNADITLKEKVHSDLVAGLRMNLGHLVLEGSLAARLKEAAVDVKNNHT